MNACLGIQFCSINSYVCFLFFCFVFWVNHVVFLTMDLEHIVISRLDLIPPVLLILLRILCRCQGSFWGSMWILKIGLFYIPWKTICDFWLGLHLIYSFGKRVIFTILILPIYEHGISSSVLFHWKCSTPSCLVLILNFS